MERRSSDIDLLTLFIAAVASAVAAFVTSQVWEGGTIIAAAMTPVIVALVKEGLVRPVDKISTLREQRTGEAAVTVHKSSGRRWRVAIVSGLAAFALVVALFTVPELIAGSSAGRGGDSQTTFFGGAKRDGGGTEKQGGGGREQATPAPTEPATEEAEPTPEPTPEAEETEAPEPTPTPEPTVAETPAASATP